MARDLEKHKKAKHDWYVKNKELTQSRSRIRRDLSRKRNQEFVRNLKETTPCSDCKQFYHWYVMDFDHVRGTKSQTLVMLVKHAYSLETIKKEIEKCDIVCSNCHRIRKFERKQFAPV